jgi:hypothetical protein
MPAGFVNVARAMTTNYRTGQVAAGPKFSDVIVGVSRILDFPRMPQFGKCLSPPLSHV